jgi:hypothetical protein
MLIIISFIYANFNLILTSKLTIILLIIVYKELLMMHMFLWSNIKGSWQDFSIKINMNNLYISWLLKESFILIINIQRHLAEIYKVK